MKKEKKKKTIFFTAGIIVGLLISCGGVYAATYINAVNVGYSNSTSGLTSTNMQDALDEAYANAIEEYECSVLGETSDNGYFCSVSNEWCGTSTMGYGDLATPYYAFPRTKYNVTILMTLDDISSFRFIRGKSWIGVPVSSVSSSTISKFKSYNTASSATGTSYGISLSDCKQSTYYWKKLE